jgi:hypothetical protein
MQINGDGANAGNLRANGTGKLERLQKMIFSLQVFGAWIIDGYNKVSPRPSPQ